MREGFMMLATFTKRLMAFAAMLLSVALGFLMLWTAARKSGKAEADTANANNEVERIKRETDVQIKVERQENERQTEGVQNANKVISNNAAVGDDAVVERLRKWRRIQD